jgi:hypothetical protein
MLRAAGIESRADEPPPGEPPAATEHRVVPQSVVSRRLANPFLAPDVSAVRPSAPRPTRLATWELIGPLLSSFERAGSGAAACMALPAPTSRYTPRGLDLMPHQARLVAAAAAGHRTFLLADEPGLGKTAQALLAAEAANAYPLLVAVPNVVKTNWAREAGMWTPHRSATVIHGNGDSIDGFADIVVVNYEVLDRHVGWLGGFGLRGMVVDEAHFIKNKSSQRSRHVLALSERIRSFTARPLLMALTGTPLINDIEDFRAIWQFLGWIDETKPLAELMNALDETGLTPADPGFYAAARQSVVDLGIVRRRKVDVAADIPARRIADLPVELDGPAGRSIRAAERELARHPGGEQHALAAVEVTDGGLARPPRRVGGAAVEVLGRGVAGQPEVERRGQHGPGVQREPGRPVAVPAVHAPRAVPDPRRVASQTVGVRRATVPRSGRAAHSGFGTRLISSLAIAGADRPS